MMEDLKKYNGKRIICTAKIFALIVFGSILSHLAIAASPPATPAISPSGAYTVSWGGSGNGGNNLYEKAGNGSWRLLQAAQHWGNVDIARRPGVYYYRMQECNTTTNGSLHCSYSSESSTRVEISSSYLPIPTPIAAALHDNTSYTLRWPSSAGASTYHLYQAPTYRLAQPDNGSWNRGDGWKLIDVTSATSKRITEKNIYGPYKYKVKSCSASNICSAFSEIETVRAGRRIANTEIFSDDGKMDKPIIFVEGYDPANEFRPKSFLNMGLHRLIFGGRDLVIVNFPDSKAALDDNAELLRQVIQDVNALKIGSHPTAVMGYSMGGVVAKKSLRYLEGTDTGHDTSVYISYDAPHLGANAPLAIQNTSDYLIRRIDEFTFGYTPSALKEVRSVYKSDAALGLLIPEDATFTGALPSSFPEQLARIGITSGSMSGTLQSPSVTPGQHIADFNIGVTTDLFDKSWDQTWESQRRGRNYYDNVPGGYLYQFDDVIGKLLNADDNLKFTGLYMPIRGQRITFVPTLSALAIKGHSPTQDAIDLMSYSPFDHYIVHNGTRDPFCSTYSSQTALGVNARHDQFYPDQIDQVICALKEYHVVGAEIPDRSGKAYNITPEASCPVAGALIATACSSGLAGAASTAAEKCCNGYRSVVEGGYSCSNFYCK